MPFIIIMILLVCHEIGHFLTAFLLGIEVDKISIYPYGGISSFNMNFNEKLSSEFIILIMGPIFQILTYYILINTNFFYNYIPFIRTYHYSLLFFNLLPIYPLDGGKLLNIIFNLKFSFKKSIIYSLYFSYFIVFIIFILTLPNFFKINIILMILLLLYKIREEKKKKNYYFEKFLLERHLNNFHFKKNKVVSSIDDFHKGYNHLIYKDHKYYTEKEILNKKFYNQNKKTL